MLSFFEETNVEIFFENVFYFWNIDSHFLLWESFLSLFCLSLFYPKQSNFKKRREEIVPLTLVAFYWRNMIYTNYIFWKTHTRPNSENERFENNFARNTCWRVMFVSHGGSRRVGGSHFDLRRAGML